jgi:SOS response regulatory protein OraA/RecX
MEPHRPRTPQSDSAERPKRGRRRDALPLDAQWLEQEAIRYVAQWETTARGLAETLERRLYSRCDRTGEDAATILSSIPLVVGRLVERGYVDDRRFAEQQITRGRRQGRSGAQIRARLHAKGVEPETIEEVELKLRSEQSADPDSPATPAPAANVTSASSQGRVSPETLPTKSSMRPDHPKATDWRKGDEGPAARIGNCAGRSCME